MPPISRKKKDEPLEKPREMLDINEILEQAHGEWYVVHTYSGYENKIKVDLTKRVESMGMQDKVFQILIPDEEEIEYKGGKKRLTMRRIFPGYVLVNMHLDDDSWRVVYRTPGVTGFVGSGTKPIPLREDEMHIIFQRMGLIDRKPRVMDVAIGEAIRVRNGPFENFEGIVKELLVERGKVRVSITMFGRETPVELDYEQIEKM